jgi:hypothetical protein
MKRPPPTYTIFSSGVPTVDVAYTSLRLGRPAERLVNAPVADGRGDVILGDQLAELDLGDVAWARLT